MRKIRILKWLRGVALAVGCWWLIVTFTPLVQWWARALASPWGSGKGDVLVVLGADSLADSVLGISSYWRAVYAVRAVRAEGFRRVVFSGHGPGPESTAELMRDFLVRSTGIDPSRTLVDTRSDSTEENAINVGKLLGGEPGATRLVLLTSDYHTWRATRVFRKLGMMVETRPAPDALKRYSIWYLRAGIFTELCVETTKIGWYKFKGWI